MSHARIGSEDKIWERLYNATAKGAEYDSRTDASFPETLPGTRTVLLNDLEAIMAKDDPKIVVLVGESGSGKSCVARTIASRFEAQDRLAASFFFSSKHADRNNLDLLFLTIAYQIGTSHPRAKEDIVKAIRNDPRLLSTHSSHQRQFDNLVKIPLKSLHGTWKTRKNIITLDAVNEADSVGNEFTSTFQIIAELLKDATIPISHIFLTTRSNSFLGPPSPFALSALSKQLYVVQIEDYDARCDVEMFLEHHFGRIYDAHKSDMGYRYPRKWPSEDVIPFLSNKIQGRFIVASTVVRLVEHAIEPARDLDLIMTMLRGKSHARGRYFTDIDSIYRHVLNSGSVESGAESLSDIIALAEPLAFSTMSCLAGKSVRNRVLHLSAILDISYDPTQPVQIYHESLRDFLWDSDRSKSLHVAPSTSHGRLLCQCLRFMQWRLKKEDIDVVDYNDPPIRYAVTHWSYHLQHAELSDETSNLILEFLTGHLAVYLGIVDMMLHVRSATLSLSNAKNVLAKRWLQDSEKAPGIKLLDEAVRLSKFISLCVKHLWRCKQCNKGYLFLKDALEHDCNDDQPEEPGVKLLKGSNVYRKVASVSNNKAPATKSFASVSNNKAPARKRFRCNCEGCQHSTWYKWDIRRHVLEAHNAWSSTQGDQWVDMESPDARNERYQNIELIELSKIANAQPGLEISRWQPDTDIEQHPPYLFSLPAKGAINAEKQFAVTSPAELNAMRSISGRLLARVGISSERLGGDASTNASQTEYCSLFIQWADLSYQIGDKEWSATLKYAYELMNNPRNKSFGAPPQNPRRGNVGLFIVPPHPSAALEDARNNLVGNDPVALPSYPSMYEPLQALPDPAPSGTPTGTPEGDVSHEGGIPPVL